MRTPRHLLTVIAATAVAAVASVVMPASAAATTLYATVGPGYTISLKTGAGVTVRTVRARTYSIVVRDQSTMHNFRLSGYRVNRATGVATRGTTTWNVTFRSGTYRYNCDPHPSMTGTVRVT